jgi:hypothetical protein
MSFVLFLAAAAALLFALTAAGFAFSKKRTVRGLRWLKISGLIPAAYILLLLGISLGSRPQKLGIGETQCFGDWCTSVTQSIYQNKQALITLRVENRSKSGGVTPDMPVIRALDSRGRGFAPDRETGPPLDSVLRPGESFTKDYRFYLAPDSEGSGIEVSTGNKLTPLLIGHPNSPFHKRPVTPIEQ